MGESEADKIVRAVELAIGAEAYHEDFWPSDSGGSNYSNEDIGWLINMVQQWSCDAVYDLRQALFNTFGMPFVTEALQHIIDVCND